MNTFIQSDSTTDAWGHYPSQTIRYDLLATNGVRVLIDEMDQWLYLVPSKSAPGTQHMVSLAWGTQHGHCDCKGFGYRAGCRHRDRAWEAWVQLTADLRTITRFSNPNNSTDDQAYGAELLAAITWTASSAEKAVA